MSPRPSRLSRGAQRLIGLVAFACLAVAPAVAESRVVAIADVHGDLPAFEAVLRDAGVVDAAGGWIAGDATVVQLGDLIDRGPAMKTAFDRVMALERQAPAGGGRFVSILGNHEVMNLVGDLRYVVPANYAEFADAGSEKRQAEAWRDYQAWRRARAAARGEAAPRLGSAEKKAWLASHPPGLIEHREAFAPTGTYGRWLRARPALFTLGDTLFVHGSVPAQRTARTIEAIERQVHEEIARFDELFAGFVAEGLVLPYFDLPETTLALRDELAAMDAAEARERAAAEAAGTAYTPPADADARRARLERFLGWGEWSIFTSAGPLWCREFAQWDDERLAAEVPKLRQELGVERFVVGHTPTPKGKIVSRSDGAVYLADTGMNSSYVKGGRGSALEFAGGTVTAIYAGGVREILRAAVPPAPSGEASTPAPTPAAESQPAPEAEPSPPPPRAFLAPDGQPLPFASDDELLAFLRDAKVVEVKDIGEGITRPRRLTLEQGGVRARAVFRNVSQQKRVADLGGGRREVNFRDFHGFEPAAYRLSRLFGLDRVPPADRRRHGGEDGSVQIWIEKATTEGGRKEAGLTPPDTVRWKRQLQTMLVWDALVGNTDRNQGNILFGPDWEIWFIDHTRSFRQSTDLPDGERIIWCARTLFEKLRSVRDDEIREVGRGLLTPGEIRGVIERRKKLVALIEGLIAAKGESAVLFDKPI
jgi:hypothetical protein